MSETTTSKLIFLPDEQPIQITNEAEFIVFKENFKQSYHKIYTLRQAQKLDNVLEYACYMHRNQLRDSGEPYVTHPICVAKMLLDYGLDVNTIAAALLHDCIEDTEATASDIRTKFGPGVAELVVGVTKLDKLQFKSKEEAQAENFRRMFFAMAKDIRVIIIKLADRLHNMRTIDGIATKDKLILRRKL